MKRDSFPARFLASEKNLGWRAYTVLFLLSLAFFLPGFTTIPPVDRDEPRFAQATRQMIESGNYVDIQFKTEKRYKKPIGIYWLQAASVELLSAHDLSAIWAYRVPSLIGATVAVIMTAAVGDLLFGPVAGFLAALLMACCALLNVEARLATTDAALLACVMVAQYALARAFVARAGFGTALSFWTAQGVGFLIKGPIIFMVSLATLLTLWMWERRDKAPAPLAWAFALRPALGVPYALLIILPWFVAISFASHGAFMEAAAGHDFLGKIWQGQDRGSIPPGAHLLAMPFVFLRRAASFLLSRKLSAEVRQTPQDLSASGEPI